LLDRIESERKDEQTTDEQIRFCVELSG